MVKGRADEWVVDKESEVARGHQGRRRGLNSERVMINVQKCSDDGSRVMRRTGGREKGKSCVQRGNGAGQSGEERK